MKRPRFILAEEAQRIAQVKARGMRPEGVGEGIIDCAPARGPVRVLRPQSVIRTVDGNIAYRRTAEVGASAIRGADAFDVMELQSLRKSRKVGGLLFTAAQKQAGRMYGEVYERVRTGSVKGSNLELEVRGGGDGRSLMDSLIDDAQRLRRMNAALKGWAMVPGAGSVGRDKRQAIGRLHLVQLVAVDGLTITPILKRFGWPERKTEHRVRLREALTLALDAIYGL